MSNANKYVRSFMEIEENYCDAFHKGKLVKILLKEVMDTGRTHLPPTCNPFPLVRLLNENFLAI